MYCSRPFEEDHVFAHVLVIDVESVYSILRRLSAELKSHWLVHFDLGLESFLVAFVSKEFPVGQVSKVEEEVLAFLSVDQAVGLLQRFDHAELTVVADPSEPPASDCFVRPLVPRLRASRFGLVMLTRVAARVAARVVFSVVSKRIINYWGRTESSATRESRECGRG